MIIKSISRRNNSEQLIKYIFKEQALTPKSYKKMIAEIKAEHLANKAVYVAGIRLSKDNIRQLVAESQDAKMLRELKKFDGTIKEFIEERLEGKISVLPKELQGLAKEAKKYENAKEFSEDLLYHGTGKEIGRFQTEKFDVLWTTQTPALAQAYIPEKTEGHIKDGQEKLPDGTLYVIPGKNDLKLYDATHVLLDLVNPGKLENDFFKEKQKLGYDGIKVYDVVSTNGEKSRYFGVGIFSKTLEKLNPIPVAANHVKVEAFAEPRSEDFNPEKFYKKAMREPEPFIIKHNLRGDTIAQFNKEFRVNEAQRIHTSSRQVAIHHTILSWADADAEKVNDAMLKDLANEYIRLRGENNLYVGTVHREKDHVHLHLAMSATRLDGISSRIPKEVFQEIKVKLQQYQKEKYPELSHSLPKHRMGNDKKVDKEAEKNIKTQRRSSDKEILLGLLETTYEKSQSVEQFLEEIKKHGHEPYYRNGTVLQGIKFEGNQKFRFTNLGFSKDKILELDTRKDKEENEVKELAELRQPTKNRLLEIEKKDFQGRPIVIGEEAIGLSEDEQRNYNQQLLDSNREFESTHGIPMDLDTIPMSPTEIEDLTKLVNDNLCDDCRKEAETPGYNNPRYYTGDTFDMERYHDHVLEELIHLSTIRGVFNSKDLDSKDIDDRRIDTNEDSKDEKPEEKESRDTKDDKDERAISRGKEPERGEDDLER